MNNLHETVFSTNFPLFATTLYGNPSVKWSSIILGCIAAGLAPIPFAFYIMGPQNRAWLGLLLAKGPIFSKGRSYVNI